MFVHANLTPFKAMVKRQVLYDMDPDVADDYIACTVFSVSSYVGSVPTFQILIGGENIFSYIPPHLLLVKKSNIQIHFELNDLVYHNCPDTEFASVVLDYLVDKPLSVFLKNKKLWIKGAYLFTMDWYQGNDLMHCISLENGQLGFFPSHKITFGEHEFPSYRKLHQEWKV